MTRLRICRIAVALSAVGLAAGGLGATALAASYPSSGHGYALRGTGPLSTQTFIAGYGAPSGQDYFRGRVVVTPVLSSDGEKIDVVLSNHEIHTVTLAQHPVCVGCVDLGYKIFLNDWERYPFLNASQALATFDTGQTVTGTDVGNGQEFVVPRGASRLDRLQITVADKDGYLSRVLTWPAAVAGGGGSSFPWWILAAVAAVAAAATGLALLSRRRGPRDRKDEKPARVWIDTPEDLTIRVAGKEISFAAHTEPPGYEQDITWEVPLDQQQTVSAGNGPAFTTSWTETGVKQVVARVGDAADDVLLVVFRTPTGKATLGDILERVSPVVERGPRDYAWYRERALPPDDPAEERVEA